MKLLSIIVPVYNVKNYIRQCIDSILNQTLENFEVILVDDGSSDGSGSICDEYAKNDKRVKVIHQKNSGVSVARNVGLKFASGDYIAFVDSDDYIAPDMYKVLVNKLIECGADMVKCGYYEFVDNKITNTRKFKVSAIYDNTLNKDDLLKLGMSDVLYTVVWNAVYTRKLADKVLYPVGLLNEDNYASPMYLLESEKVAVIENALYYYRQNPNGLNKASLVKKPLDKFFCYNMLYKTLCERGFKNSWSCKHLSQVMSEIVYRVVKYNKVKVELEHDIWDFVLKNARWDRRVKLKIWYCLGRVVVLEKE